VPQKKVRKQIGNKKVTENVNQFEEEELIACGRELELAQNEMTGDIDVVGTAPIPVTNPREAAVIL
jgi:hypothetical protein